MLTTQLSYTQSKLDNVGVGKEVNIVLPIYMVHTELNTDREYPKYATCFLLQMYEVLILAT